VLNKSNYIMGEEVAELENNLTRFTGAKHVIACSSGTDALLLAMMALDIQPGDEVITTPFTFIATAETIALLRAIPVFVDIESDTFNIDASKIDSVITDKTKIIMPVSIFGQPCDLDEICSIAKKNNLKLIVDGAQSFGSLYKNKMEVHYCDIYTTSFFPAKPLGCYGDGGAVFTNNEGFAEKIKTMRVHGQVKRYCHKYIGMGGRMDTIQAAVLLAKLPHYEREIILRQEVAENYTRQLPDSIHKPSVRPDRTSVWAQYTIRVSDRDEVRNELRKKGVPTAVHYPVPLHQQECFKYLNNEKGGYPVSENVASEVISLPMNPYLADSDVQFVSELISDLVES